MNVWHSIKRLWARNDNEPDMPFSIVLLLRDSVKLSGSDIQTAAEQGWGKSFDGQQDPMYFVVEKGTVLMLKAGQHIVQILQASGAYLDDLQGVAKQLPQEEQRRAWLQHSAWIALDYWNQDRPKTDAYETLSRLAWKLADSNCVGIYLPRDSVFMPNDGTAEEGLQLLVKRELF